MQCIPMGDLLANVIFALNPRILVNFYKNLFAYAIQHGLKNCLEKFSQNSEIYFQKNIYQQVPILNFQLSGWKFKI